MTDKIVYLIQENPYISVLSANEYGKTHYVKINTFKPEPQTNSTEKKEEALPF